jgi:hypothetical protein
MGAVTAALGLSGPLAAPAMAADSCPNAAVRAQQHATGLPQCRAYELINTPGLDLGDVNRIVYSTDDGDASAYVSVGAADDAIGAGVASISVARRGAGGWSSINADPFATGVSLAGTGFTGTKTFSDDLSRVLVDALLPLNEQDTDGISDFYRVDVGLGTSTLMTQDEDSFPFLLGGASRDLNRIAFLGNSGGVGGLWLSDGTHRELLSRYPGEAAVPRGQAQFASAQYQRGQSIGGSAVLASSSFVERGGAHGISDDARRVYFTDFGGTLFVRDLVASPARTVAVGVSSRTVDVGTQYPANFLSATHDGSVAYFSSSAQLTDDATPGGGIYRFDLATQSVTQVTADAGPSGFDVTGSIVSDDQSHIYFTSTAALAGAAQAGDTNVYVWTSGGGFRFIAKVANINSFLRVTPDGRYLLLRTSTSLAGAPNNGFEALYRYDYASDHVTCVSCRADGSPSHGEANIDTQSYGQPGAPLIRNRALSFDGQVAFTSTDRLVRDDQTYASDVYLYHDGTVSLLTKGRGDTASFVGDISDDAKNISILTRSALVDADRDVEEYDAYDVRVGGGFLAPPSLGGPCHGEDCQGAPGPSGQDAQPSSSNVTGDGNAPPSKVAKKLSWAALTSAQRSTLARSGKLTISVRVTGGGKVSLRGRGRLSGQTKTVGSASDIVLKSKETAVKLSFKLSTAARRELSRRHRLSFTLEARLSGVSKTVSRTINLTRAR